VADGGEDGADVELEGLCLAVVEFVGRVALGVFREDDLVDAVFGRALDFQ